MVTKDFLMGFGAGKAQGGGSSVSVEPLSVSANGAYTAPTGKAYSPVNVSVPNTYTSADEGKVVDNGALVAQTTETVTQNGTVDTTLINSLIVNVSGGGGIGTLLKTESLGEVETSSSSEQSTGKTLTVPGVDDYDLLLVLIEADDKSKTGHLATASLLTLTASSSMAPLPHNKNGTSILSNKLNFQINGGVVLSRTGTTSYGVYPVTPTHSSGSVTMQISCRYHSTQTTAIDNSYTAKVYGISLYDLL